MVVLAAALCTKSGKPLLSRQFVDISRSRIEGLLAAFPKLMGTGKQHTFIETENIRYVYQPLENLYILIITNKSSNILEDLETLHILAKLVPEFCKSLDEKEVLEKAYDLIFAFDEVIALGYKEKVTIQQINTFLRMESQEEIIQIMVQENKEKLAKEEALVKINQMERLRKTQTNQSQSYAPSSMLPGARGSPSSNFDRPSDFGSHQGDPFVVSSDKKSEDAGRRAEPVSESRGMVLKPKETTSQFLRAVAKEDTSVTATSSKSRGGASSAVETKDPVQVELVETVSALLTNDGALLNPLQVLGLLSITINDAKYAGVNFRFNNFNDKNYNYKPHPNINKAKWSGEGVVTLKSEGKSFPVGAQVNILKWRYTSNKDSAIPLTVACWPTDEGDGTTLVTLEYDFKPQNKNNFSLGDVVISIPIIGAQPIMSEIEVGVCEFDVKNHVLKWKIDLIDAESKTGSMEFNIPAGGDTSGLFPIKISFVSNSCFSPLEVAEVVQKTGETVPYAFIKSLQSTDYRVSNLS